jgi:acetyl esterase/lipase
MDIPDTDLAAVRLPQRDIPPPSTISAEARLALAAGAVAPVLPWPAAADIDAWREAVAGSAAMWEPIAAQMLSACRSSVETRTIGGVTCYVGAPPGLDEAAGRRVYMYLHGGALVFGGGAYAKAFAGILADSLGVTTVSVDYRMPPDHPFPAAPEDCLAVYRALIETHDPKHVVIGGSSAGGNLAAATTLMIRDQGLPQPAALVLLTPEVDLTEAGDTFRTNALLDVTLKGGLPECNALYAAGHDLTDPYVSPLFGDFTTGFPPTLIQSGTRDILLSNSVLMHRKLRKAGVEAELHVWEGMPHAGFGMFGIGDAPENREIEDEVRRFIARHA